MAARQRLGFRRIGDQWFSDSQLQGMRLPARRRHESLRRWLPRLVSIRRRLHQAEPLDTIGAEISEIDDPSAIATMEAVLSIDSDVAAGLVLEKIKAMDDPEGTLSQVRHALFVPWMDVCQRAAEYLQRRPLESYVPVMLTALRTPVVTDVQLSRGRGGSLVYRHRFAREGQHQLQVAILETEHQRFSQWGGSTMVAQWWAWWNDENEVYVQGVKRVATSYQGRTSILGFWHRVGEGSEDFPRSTPAYGQRAARRESVERGATSETYNLVIADFHTFFVGRTRILSHDNTIRQPTNALVPGLSRTSQ